MGSKGGSDAPTPPNAAATAGAQAAANKETAIAQSQLNQVNQVTPTGSLTWGERGKTAEGIPQYTATQTLAPAQQQMLDLTNQAGIKYGQTANAQLNTVSDRLAQPLDFSSLGAAPQANQQAWDTAYNGLIQRNQPQADRQLATLQNQLANQGISMGSQAYKTAMDQYGSNQNDFNLAAQQAAQGQMSSDYGLQSAARNQQINEMLQQRSVPLNELAAMLTGAQVQQPSYVNAPQAQIQAPDIMGATYNNYAGQQSAANSANQMQASNNQGLAGLAGTAAMAGAYFF